MATNSGRPLETLEDGRPRFHGCSRIQQYDYICKLGEGTFGEVSKAKTKTGQVVALKKILMHNEKDGFPITALREIKLLKQLDHVNVLKLLEMAVERPKSAAKKTSMFMVTPYMDHDLSGLLENPNVKFTEPQRKCYMKQLLEGCAYLHENRILHRDMKAANLLINNKGILQIADFGLARPYDDEPPKPGQGGGEATREYTTLVVTRWYRPPELLLQLRKYTTAIDMWGVGCVFGEMFKGKPILAGSSDLNQAQLIFTLVGGPTDETMPGWRQLPGVEGNLDFKPRPPILRREFSDIPELAISLLEELLRLDWRKRINAIDALKHPYFHTEPLPAKPGELPQFEESHELDRRKFRDQKNKPPPAPAGGEVGVGPHGEWGINGRPLPPDHRGGRPPYANGHRQHRDRGPPRNRGPPGDYRRGPRDDRDRDRDLPPRDHPRPYQDDYGRRPPPAADNLPPRPPPGREDPYREQYNQAPPPFREDDRGVPRPRGPPLDRRGPDRGPPRDTFVPAYSNADAPRRPPPPRNDPDFPRYPPGRPSSRDYDEPIRYDDGPGPRYGGPRHPPRDYDEPPLRYDDRPPPPRRGSNDYDDRAGPPPRRSSNDYDDPRGYHDAPPPSRGRMEGGPPPPMEGIPYNRIRSRSPRGRDWDRDRPPRDRDYDYDRRPDYRR